MGRSVQKSLFDWPKFHEQIFLIKAQQKNVFNIAKDDAKKHLPVVSYI